MITDIIKTTLKPVLDLVDSLTTTDEEKLNIKAAIRQAELGATERIISEELKQDDKYTKRARPTIVYAGLITMFVNYVLLPWIAFFFKMEIPTITLPSEFWFAWGGVTGVYAFQRTNEKIKAGK